MSRNTVVVLGVFAALYGCTKEAPEFTANDQVPAEQRTSAEPAASGGAAPEGGVWVVEGNDLAFDEAPTTLPAGAVSLTLQNNSGLPHTIAFDGVQGGQAIVKAPANGSDTGTVTLEPGTYTYFCDVAGHRAAGMEGQVTLE